MFISDFPMISEIRNEYSQLRAGGLSREKCEQVLCNKYNAELAFGFEDDGVLFWIGLSDAQYQNGELSWSTAQCGLHALEFLMQSGWDICLDDLEKRKKQYSDVSAHQKPTIPQRKKFRCQWKIGDTFAHEISGTSAERLGISGQLALLRKVDEIEFGDGRLLPIVTLSICAKENLPQTAPEFQTIPLLRLECGRLGTPSTRYEYRAEILFKSNKQLATTPLFYVGCFPDIALPKDEVVFTNAGKLMMILPEQLSEDCCLFWKMDKYYSSKV